MDIELREAIEANREKTEAAIRDLSVLKTEFFGLKSSLAEKHDQNRRDIHSIRNELQSMTDRFTLKLERIGKDFNDKIDKIGIDFNGFCTTMTGAIHKIQLESARNKGYWLGIGGAAIVGLDLIKIAIEHFWK